jgi:hypothetical protein
VVLDDNLAGPRSPPAASAAAYAYAHAPHAPPASAAAATAAACRNLSRNPCNRCRSPCLRRSLCLRRSRQASVAESLVKLRFCWEHSKFKRPTTTQINNAEYVRVTDMKIEIEGLDNFGTR